VHRAERTNSHNRHHQRQFGTHTGSLDMDVPELRHGSYIPDWLLERIRVPSAP